MAIDFFDGHISKEPVKVDKDMVPKLLQELAVGQVCMVDTCNLAITKEGERVISTTATVTRPSGEEGVEDEFTHLARVVKTNDGYIVDVSHSYEVRREWADELPLQRVEEWYGGEDPERTEHIIGYIDNPDEFALVTPLIRDKYGISLEFIKVE